MDTPLKQGAFPLDIIQGINRMQSEENFETDDIGQSQAVKAALHYTIGNIVEEVGTEYKMTFSKPLIATFAEFINRQIEIYALDLEAFAKHARRTTINCEDVKLLVRRNRKLKEIITEMSEFLEPSTSGVSKPKKGRKRKLDADDDKSNLENISETNN